MKSPFKKLVALSLLAWAGGCISLDEPLVSKVTSQYYATAQGLTAASNALYSGLRGHWGREESMAISQLGTDTWFNGDQVAAGGAQAWSYLNDYSVQLNSADARLQATWNNFYQQINIANAVLDRGPNTTNVTTAIKNSRLVEALFFRALYYFY